MTGSSYSYRELKEEADRVLPELVDRMWGNGSLHLDTDALDLGNERDRGHLEWLARIVAGFILRDRRAKHVEES